MKAIRTISWTVALALTALFSSCSTPQEVRDTAGLLAGHTNDVRKELESFAKSREELAKARRILIDRLEESAVEAELKIKSQRRAWKVSGQSNRGKLYDKILAAANAAAEDLRTLEKLRADQQESVARIKRAVAVNSDKLSKTTKSLRSLAEPPSFKEDLAFYYGFFSEVRSSLKEAAERAKEDAMEGKQQIEKKKAEMNLP